MIAPASASAGGARAVTVKKYNRKPTNTFQKGENLVIFLETVKSKGIKLVNIGPDDLQGGNQRLILGLTWTLILRYEVQKYGAGEMELLKWVEKTTEGYKGARKLRQLRQQLRRCNCLAKRCVRYSPCALCAPAVATAPAPKCSVRFHIRAQAST